MAAIIARLARANRERKKNLGKWLPAEKSAVVLMPFEKNFDPVKHNKYIRAKTMMQERLKREKVEWVREAFNEGEENPQKLEDLKSSYRCNENIDC